MSIIVCIHSILCSLMCCEHLCLLLLLTRLTMLLSCCLLTGENLLYRRLICFISLGHCEYFCSFSKFCLLLHLFHIAIIIIMILIYMVLFDWFYCIFVPLSH